MTMTDLTPFQEQHQPPITAPSTTSAVLADSSPGPFEGPEKLLEIWFAPSPNELPRVTRTLGNSLEYRAKKQGNDGQERDWRGLRSVKREVWEDMLRVVKCQVLSVIEGEELDAYLLRSVFPVAVPHSLLNLILIRSDTRYCPCLTHSESSLFIAPHLVILKTCGTTINLLGLTRIIEIAREYCGFEHVHRCFYSRKSFFFPERQVGPHVGWKEEVDFLDGVFSESAVSLGPPGGRGIAGDG